MMYHFAKRIRNQRVLRHITHDDTHLDIGGGDGWLLAHSPARLRCDVPNHAEKWLPQMDDKYSVITLIAVVEHLDDPRLVLRECLRMLTPGGRIIITAPTILGQIFVPLVDHAAEREHKRIVSHGFLRRVLPPGCAIYQEYFEFWFNQLFIITREMI